eukprot:2280013-Pleurochrysis_carterae.AAC.1
MKNGVISGPLVGGAKATTGTRIARNAAPRATSLPLRTIVVRLTRVLRWQLLSPLRRAQIKHLSLTQRLARFSCRKEVIYLSRSTHLAGHSAE